MKAFAPLSQRIRQKTARVGVLGLGYVGLPLALEFCRKGFRVLGFEVSPARLARLRRGRSYVLDIADDRLEEALGLGLFEPTDKFDRLSACDIIIICVQTPLRKTRDPDLSHIFAATKEAASRMRPGQLVVLESTTFPGTTDEVVRPLLEAGGRRLGKDFFLAFSPERVDPGNSRWNIANTPKVVGGAEPNSTALAAELYGHIVDQVVPVSSTKAAEVVKLLENSFRAVNIALVNEMAQICHRLELDVWEIISAAATKPFGFMPFYPGPGIGGHCIPKDPQLLTWKMKTLDFEPRFIELASSINGAMPRYTVARIAEVLNKRRRALNGSKILVLGVAYKPDTTDYRDSPALDVMELLRQAGARVSYHDPFVPEVRIDGARWKGAALSDGLLRSSDCVAIMTAHKSLDYRRVIRLASCVFDARNATADIGVSAKVFRL
ncbi:MAG: nucleotide sugar dehydrogenase [Elusimicrobia bacterium]|nr:nucleotide sugar dehydrogenase [Elusimicrobiota bacterium]